MNNVTQMVTQMEDSIFAMAAQCGYTFTKIGRALDHEMTQAVLRWEQAEARRQEQWRRKQRNDIRRQLLALNTTYFGRKRRARRARGGVMFNPDFYPTPTKITP